MQIKGIIWLENIVEKITTKHNVAREEVIEIFKNKPYFLYVEKGFRKMEDVYSVLGRTSSGRYLIAFFVYKRNKNAIIISARDMTDKEKKKYEKK